MPLSRSISLALLATLCACKAPTERIEGPAPRSDSEGALAAAPGWSAAPVHESDSGIWTTGALKCFPRHGFPELFALDDAGRCTLLVGYSGQYTAVLALQDREWLGALEPLALERPKGEPELYAGGKRGLLYQCRVHADTSFDTRVVARFPGEEIHTLVGGELDPEAAGLELLAFTHPGHVYALRPPRAPGEDFRAPRIATLKGRVRQCVRLPVAPGQAPRIAAVSRAGELLLLALRGEELSVRVLLSEPSGFGRLALAPSSTPAHAVLYATRDDGVVLRLEQGQDDSWSRELVYAGPQGPRGLAAGRFVADSAVESLAVFGYSGRVELLTRRAGEPWSVETLFVDRDRGHWLAAAELDGRNATDELLCSGYGARVVLLARAPGYGLEPGTPSTPTE